MFAGPVSGNCEHTDIASLSQMILEYYSDTQPTLPSRWVKKVRDREKFQHRGSRYGQGTSGQCSDKTADEPFLKIHFIK